MCWLRSRSCGVGFWPRRWCLNFDQVKRFCVSGRPESFATTAAKGLLSDAVNIFQKCHGRRPLDVLAASASATTSRLLGDACTQAAALCTSDSRKRRGRSKGTLSAWDVFVKDSLRSLRDTPHHTHARLRIRMVANCNGHRRHPTTCTSSSSISRPPYHRRPPPSNPTPPTQLSQSHD